MAKDTEQLILETARKHFVQHGFAATRMQEIADEAGINKALLHYYFRSKQKLFERIVEQVLDFVMPRFAKALEQGDTFWERVENLVDTYIQTLMKQPDIPIFIMTEISQKREHFVEEIKKRSSYFPAVQGFMGLMMQEMQIGKIRQVNPLQFFLNVVGMCVFPFIAKPIFEVVFEVSEDDFKTLMKERKAEIMLLLKRGLQP